MIIGELDRRIILQRFTTTQNENGEPSKTWTTFATVYAKKEDQGGSEIPYEQKLTAMIPVKFTIRYRTDVDEKIRIVYNNDNYDILSIDEIPRFRGLILTAICRK